MAGFSKLIWADALANAQKIAVVGNLDTPDYKAIGDNEFSPLIQADGVKGYTAEAQKAVLFTADGYIATHGYQYYTGIPTSGKSAIGLVRPFNINTGKVNSANEITNDNRANSALVITEAFNTKTEGENGNYKYTVYGIQTDVDGKPYVVTENAAQYSHKLSATGNISGTSTKAIFDPTKDTTWAFATAINTATEGNPDNHYNKFTISDGTTTVTASIDPAIANNIIAKSSATHTAKHLVVFESGNGATNDVLGGADTSIEVSDSGFVFGSVAGDGYAGAKGFTKGTAGTNPWDQYSDSTIPTEKAVAKYVSTALGEISGALRYKGAASHSASSNAWYKTGTTSTAPSITDTGHTKDNANAGVAGYDAGTITSAEYTSTTKYQQGDVYYVNTAGWYANQWCEVGDMLIAINDELTAYSASDWTVVQNNWTAVDGTSKVDWGKKYTLATIGGVDIDIEMPASPVSESNFVFNAGTKTTGSVNADKSTYTVIPDPLTGSTTNGQSYLNYYGYTLTYDSETEAYVKTATNYNIQVQGAIKTVTEGDTNPTYTAAGSIISVESVRTDENNQILNIVHGNDMTSGHTKGLMAFSYDRWGHVTGYTDITNKITIHGNSGNNISNLKTDDTYAGETDTDWYITGSTSTGGVTTAGAGTGHVNGDISLKTQIVSVNAVGTEGETGYVPAHTELQVYVDSFQLRYRKISISSATTGGTNEEVVGQTNLNDLIFAAGSNVKLTTSSDTEAKTSTITIDARDTWRPIKYYWKNETTQYSPGATTSGYDDDDDTPAATANFDLKSLSTNQLIFGQEFAMRKDSEGVGSATEVHIEWCEISGTTVSYTY